MTELEKNILLSKGLSKAQLGKLTRAGVKTKKDFATIGDAATLAGLIDASKDVAEKVMAWATGASSSSGGTHVGHTGGAVTVDSNDVVYCAHCKAKQPKDYKSGDLCPSCGKQAEPIFACFWCGHSGPGKFCRSCAAEFVPTGELDLAVLLKRDGLSKDAIPEKLKGMSKTEKDALWGRVRKSR